MKFYDDSSVNYFAEVSAEQIAKLINTISNTLAQKKKHFQVVKDKENYSQ